METPNEPFPLSFSALVMVATSWRLTPAAAPVPVEGNRDGLAAVSGDWCKSREATEGAGG
jgi:hypothetical protein